MAETDSYNGSQVEMRRSAPHSRMSAERAKPENNLEEPIVPTVVQTSRRSPLCLLSDEEKANKAEQVSADDEGSRDGEEDNEKPTPAMACTPRTKKKVDNFKQGLAARRIQRTWKHFYQELEERKESSQNSTLERPSSDSKLTDNTRNQTNASKVDEILLTKVDKKTKLVSTDESAVRYIQAVMEAHDTRSRTLSGLRSKFLTARPWQKKSEANASESSQIGSRNFAELSEEEMDQVCRKLQSVLHGHETRLNVLKRLEEDRDLFTTGKVSRMRAAISARKSSNDGDKRFYERSDGVTDDDDDVAY